MEQEGIEIGDIAQLSFDRVKFVHSLIIVKIENIFDLNHIYIAAHTNDAYNRAISTYGFDKIRFIHIK